MAYPEGFGPSTSTSAGSRSIQAELRVRPPRPWEYPSADPQCKSLSGEPRATSSVGRKLKSVAVPAENRAIQPHGEGFQDESKKVDVRMYELE